MAATLIYRSCIIVVVWVSAIAMAVEDTDWPGFRGHLANGRAEGFPSPEKWDVETGENILWKIAIPGLAHSCPIIWGDHVFAVTAISGKKNVELKVGLYGNIQSVEDDTVHSWWLYALDRNKGTTLWKRKIHQGVPEIKRHTKASHANTTPVTDGRHIVTFLGSEGIFCHDMEGNLLWKKDFGLLDSGFFRVPEAQWGFASSPIIYQGKLIVQCDVQKDSFIAALNLADGDEIWRTSRDEVPTWSTPALYFNDGRPHIAVNGFKHMGGYDLATGKEVWRMAGGGDIPVPTPLVERNLIFIANAHGGKGPLYAIKTEAKGDLSLGEGQSSNEFVVWSHEKNGAYMQTPIIYGNLIFSCRNSGVLNCYDLITGEQKYRQRLNVGGTGFTASPVAAGGKIYFTSEVGDVYVVAAQPEYKLLRVNAMDEVCMATPALSQGRLYFRTKGHLVAVGFPGK